MIELKGFGHNSLTDNPFIYPESFIYEIDSKSALEISRKIVLRYFKSILVNKKSLSSTLGDIEQIKIEEFK